LALCFAVLRITGGEEVGEGYDQIEQGDDGSGHHGQSMTSEAAPDQLTLRHHLDGVIAAALKRRICRHRDPVDWLA